MAKKKEQEEPEQEVGGSRMSQLLASSAFASVKKKFGDTSLVVASEHKIQKIARIPSGIFPLDHALGGGWPIGRMHTLYGKKSSSKTTTVLKAIAEAQKICANCYTGEQVNEENGEVTPCACGNPEDMTVAYIDVEGTFDMAWATTVGVDTSRLLLSRPDAAETALDISEGLVRSGKCDVIILDSLAELTPTTEITESVSKDSFGGASKLIGRALRKLNAGMLAMENQFGRRPTFFMLNQIRTKIGVMYGNPETTPGGNAPGFFSTIELKCKGGKYGEADETGRPPYVDLEFRVEKNKTSVAMMEGSWRLMLADTERKVKGEVYDEDYVVSQAQRVGLIEGAGAHWSCLGEKFPAKSKIEERLLTDASFSRKLKKILLPILLAS